MSLKYDFNHSISHVNTFYEKLTLNEVLFYKVILWLKGNPENMRLLQKPNMKAQKQQVYFQTNFSLVKYFSSICDISSWLYSRDVSSTNADSKIQISTHFRRCSVFRKLINLQIFCPIDLAFQLPNFCDK